MKEKLFMAKSNGNPSEWLPLWMHLEDTAGIMNHLLEDFIPESFCDSCGMERDIFEKTALFIAYIHDIGKATVAFQYKISKSIPVRTGELEKFCIKLPDFIDDDYSKMYYEATLKTDFSDSTRKSIYQFDSNNIDYTLKLKMMKAIQFARLDHPEQELMDFDTKTNMKFLINKKGIVCKFYSLYICKNFKEYSTLLDEVNLEIQDLVTTVNNTNDIVEKYKLSYL